jgi:hypothetical protein
MPQSESLLEITAVEAAYDHAIVALVKMLWTTRGARPIDARQGQGAAAAT